MSYLATNPTRKHVNSKTQKAITILILLMLSIAFAAAINTVNAEAPDSVTVTNTTGYPASDETPNMCSESAKIWTDKADYHPGDLVTIFGSYFNTNSLVAFTVTKLKDNTTTNWSVNSDAQGNLTTTYQLDRRRCTPLQDRSHRRNKSSS